METRRGAHFHFSGSTQTRKFEHGDIKGNGYVLWPFSIINLGTPDVWTYRFAAKGPLQPFPEHLFPIPEKETNTQPIEECDTLRRITRARLWLATVEPAVSGQGGHNVMFRACCKMFQMFNLSPTEAYPLILEFNERAEPKFSERELIHKLNSAEKANGKSTVSK